MFTEDELAIIYRALHSYARELEDDLADKTLMKDYTTSDREEMLEQQDATWRIIEKTENTSK